MAELAVPWEVWERQYCLGGLMVVAIRAGSRSPRAGIGKEAA